MKTPKFNSKLNLTKFQIAKINNQKVIVGGNDDSKVGTQNPPNEQ